MYGIRSFSVILFSFLQYHCNSHLLEIQNDAKQVLKDRFVRNGLRKGDRKLKKSPKHHKASKSQKSHKSFKSGKSSKLSKKSKKSKKGKGKGYSTHPPTLKPTNEKIRSSIKPRSSKIPELGLEKNPPPESTKEPKSSKRPKSSKNPKPNSSKKPKSSRHPRSSESPKQLRSTKEPEGPPNLDDDFSPRSSSAPNIDYFTDDAPQEIFYKNMTPRKKLGIDPKGSYRDFDR